jgi:tripartite-type tricarboxylate transporter receptor subunit TctC
LAIEADRTAIQELAMWKRLVSAALAAHVSCGAWAASAIDAYPTRPIRLIVGFTPGGSDDYVGRVVGARITERFGQSVIVDNRPGAGGNIGVELLARATPDGYTLSSVGSITVASGPSLYTNIGYDPLRDFSYVARVAIGANVLFAHPTFPAKSVAELVALARSQPKAIRYGTPGVASLGHLAVELLQSVTRIELLHVPYKGPAPAVTAAVGGEVQIGVGASTAVIPVVQAKRLNALAATGAKRLSPLPDVPTVAESGFPGFSVTNNHGIVAPAGTPAPIIAKLNAEFNRILKEPDVQKAIADTGSQAGGGTPEEFAAFIKSESEKWAHVIKAGNIQLQ